MDQLAGQNVQVVLALLEGKGFDNVDNPMIIVGTLCGGSLESDFTNPEACPSFGSDLVWEATKSEIRKMRSSQEPLKVECFEYKENGIKERIGFFILSLRTAQIVPPTGDKNIKKNWHKLFGLRNDVKAYKPEILLSLIIEELRDIPTIDDNYSLDKNLSHKSMIEPKDLPRPYLIPDEGLIQLGPTESCQDLFILNVSTETVGNLKLLKVPAKTNHDKKYTFYYKILDNDIQSKPFKNDLKNWSMNEKIVIRIRTSFLVFKNYLQYRPNIFIIFKHGDSILGETSINYRPLFDVPDEQGFFDKIKNKKAILSERCYMKTLDNKNEGEKPFVDIKLQLQHVGGKKIDRPEADSTDELDKKRLLLNDHVMAKKKIAVVECHESPPGDYQKIKTQKFDNYQYYCDKSSHPFSKKNNAGKSAEAYHCYCLNISLESIKLKAGLSLKNIEFRFHHPKAEIISTTYSKISVIPGEQLKLEDVGCKLNFISSVEKIKNLLSTFPPKISVYNEENNCIGIIVVDVKRLFERAELECQYQGHLMSNDCGEIGFIEISIQLMDVGSYCRTNKQTWDDNFGPPILDDSLTYKIVDELETWKERQQEIFRVELKQKEERHLNRLSEEWKKRRQVLESSLAGSIEQCKILTENLNSATNDLRARRVESLEKEAKLIKINDEMKWTCDKKFHDLQETSEKLQKEFTEKLSLLEEEKKKNETEISLLKDKIDHLEKIIKKQSDDLVACQNDTQIQEQTQKMLQNIKVLEKKLNSTEKSKTNFKEEWGKAVREIKKLKNENQQILEGQIKSSREEYGKINLEDILKVDSAALSSDKILLDKIQREINVIKPKSSCRHDPPEDVYQMALETCPRGIFDFPKAQWSVESNESDDRLEKLIEERDLLLKTGSYSSDDAIIIQLDKEIKSIFMRPNS